MTITDAMRAAVPAPTYPCACEGCADDQIYTADMLYWYRGDFYCDSCIDGFYDDAEIGDGPTLADVLQSKRTVAVLRYLGDLP